MKTKTTLPGKNSFGTQTTYVCDDEEVNLNSDEDDADETCSNNNVMNETMWMSETMWWMKQCEQMKQCE